MPEAPAIVLVHGLGLKVGKQQELAVWRDALNRGLGGDPRFEAARLEMAYYSDELHPEVQVVARGGAGPRRRGPVDEPSAQHEAAEQQVLAALMDRYWEYDAAKRRERGLLLESAAPGTGPIRRDVHALPTVQLRPGETYATFVRDIIKYFGLGHREPVNARLDEALQQVSDGPIMLLSHSLGTVVAYDVLITGQHQVDTWITLGSPLGYVQDLQSQLRGWLEQLDVEQCVALAEGGGRIEESVIWAKNTIDAAKAKIDGFFGSLRRQAPPADRRAVYMLPAPQFPNDRVERWFNIYDPTDPVASPPAFGDPTLKDEYLSDGRERVYDIRIKNHGSDPHSGTGYLEALQTVGLVQDFLARRS